ncbi:MAG: serine/threonine-protein kinase [Fuerstiella sp.]|nr:serine/threonine-protein kinase [Fuerstiella sp.]
MTQQSSAELDPTKPTEGEVPLLDRPLVADDQNTVVSTGTDLDNSAPSEVTYSASAQEIRDRLFGAQTDEQNRERGLRIGHFDVEERIGSGGMGAVFRAVDLELSRFVALKVLHPGIAADTSLVARFRNEARSCAQLNHDNVARIFFAGEQDGIHYIAYEYADGINIKEAIQQRGKLSPAETVNYAIQATLALNHIAAAGIIHRDIKPSNIIITQSGRIKVVDLGLARRDTTDSIGDITVAGTTLGTFDYIAPEQARDPRMADIRSDIYSLGCTVYHMLTGRPPYPEGTALQKLLDHQGKTPPDPRLVANDVPVELAAIVQNMMNTDAEQRYQDPGQLLTDLISLATQMGLRSVPAEGVVWRRIPVRRIRELSGAIFLSGAVLAICLTALIFHFLPGKQEPPPDWLKDSYAIQLSAADSLDMGAAVDSAREDSTQTQGAFTLSIGTAELNQTLEQTRNSNPVPLPGSMPIGPFFPVAGSEETGVPIPQNIDTPPIEQRRIRLEPALGQPKYHNSLSSALADAKSGDEILLQFDGVQQVPSLPKLGRTNGENITLRAATGFRPVLEFRGDDEQSSVPGRLFNLTNNLNLRLLGVDLRVIVGNDAVSEEWVLFECNGPNRIELRDCTIEVRNSSRRPTTVFRLSDSPVNEDSDNLVDIQLYEVAVRGGTDVVLVDGQPTGRMRAEQCAFALDGSLISNIGSQMPEQVGHLDVTLDHTTTILSKPVVHMADSDVFDGRDPQRELSKLSVNSYSCVFASLTEDGVLIHSQGNAYLDDLPDLLTWHGNANLFHQYNVYWKLESASRGSLDLESTLMSLNEWNKTWSQGADEQEEEAVEFGSDVWNDPDLLENFSRADLSDFDTHSFALSRAQFYSGTAGMALDPDGRVPGVDSASLSGFPVTLRSPLVETLPDATD